MAVKDPGGQPFPGFERPFERGPAVGWIMIGGQPVDLFPVPAQGPLAPGDAGLDDIDVRKTLVADSRHQERFQVFDVAGEAPRHKAAVLGDGDGQGLQRSAFDPPQMNGPGLADGGGGRRLPLGQSVMAVVVHHQGHIGVATDRVDEMVSSFSVAVAFAGRYDGGELRIGGMNGQCRRQSPAVQPVEEIGLHVVRELGRLPNAGHEAEFMGLFAEFHHGHFERLQDPEIGAAGTPLDFHVRSPVIHPSHGSTSSETHP